MRNLFLAFAIFITVLNAQAAFEIKPSGPNKNFLYEHDPKALASTVQLAFETGSISDPKGKEGLSALAFESLLRGTISKDRKEFNAAVERIGASISVDAGESRVIINLDGVSENLASAIKLLAEAVTNPALSEREIESLKVEKLALLNQELGDNRAIAKRVLRQALFQDTPLAFPAEGTIEGIKSISAEDVQNFLEQHVKAGNMIVAVSSNQPEAEIRQMLEKSFQALPEGEAPALPELSLQQPKGRNLYFLARSGSATSEVAFAHLGIKANHPKRDELELGQFILGQDMSSRYFQELRAKRGWTYGAYSGFGFLDQPRHYGGNFFVYAFPQAQHTTALVGKAIEIYEEYAKKGLTSKEIAFAKQSLGNAYPFRFATSKSRLTARLYERLDDAPLLTVAKYRKKLKGMSQKDLSAAIKMAHDPKNLAIVVVGDPAQVAPLKKSIPGLNEVIEIKDPMKPL